MAIEPEKAQPRFGGVAIVGALLGDLGGGADGELEHPQPARGIARERRLHHGGGVFVERALAANAALSTMTTTIATECASALVASDSAAAPTAGGRADG